MPCHGVGCTVLLSSDIADIDRTQRTDVNSACTSCLGSALCFAKSFFIVFFNQVLCSSIVPCMPFSASLFFSSSINSRTLSITTHGHDSEEPRPAEAAAPAGPDSGATLAESAVGPSRLQLRPGLDTPDLGCMVMRARRPRSRPGPARPRPGRGRAVQ